jgi:hypothetical protein
MRLALDNHYSTVIARQLRQRGHDVDAVVERDWGLLEDEALLAACAAEQRALVTNNVPDFAVIARQWQADGRDHCGLVFTSDASRPRTRAATGRFVTDLAALLDAHPARDALANQVVWL